MLSEYLNLIDSFTLNNLYSVIHKGFKNGFLIVTHKKFHKKLEGSEIFNIETKFFYELLSMKFNKPFLITKR